MNTLRHARMFRQPYDTISAMCLRLILPFLSLCAAQWLSAAKPLEIYFVDVEGGQATLVVSPSKQTILIDSGWLQGGHDERGAGKAAGY